jgi:hypothetical protein
VNQNTGFYGSDYLITEAGQGENRAQWWDFVGLNGYYEISVWYPGINKTLGNNVQYRILHEFGVDTVFVDQNMDSGQWNALGTFFYKAGNASSILISNEDSGGKILSDAVRIRRVLKPSIISENKYFEQPTHFILYQNYPNPFNSGTVIRYKLEIPSFIKLSIYDITGRKLSTLVSEMQPAGSYKYFWDGLNDSGQKISAGIYLFRLEANNQHSCKKMILIN